MTKCVFSLSEFHIQPYRIPNQIIISSLRDDDTKHGIDLYLYIFQLLVSYNFSFLHSTVHFPDKHTFTSLISHWCYQQNTEILKKNDCIRSSIIVYWNFDELSAEMLSIHDIRGCVRLWIHFKYRLIISKWAIFPVCVCRMHTTCTTISTIYMFAILCTGAERQK